MTYLYLWRRVKTLVQLGKVQYIKWGVLCVSGSTGSDAVEEPVGVLEVKGVMDVMSTSP
jgi:hypothetical protein